MKKQKYITGVTLVVATAFSLYFTAPAACAAQEPKLAKKQVAVVQMMEQFQEKGSRFALTEAGVTPIPEERFLWSVAKGIMSQTVEMVQSSEPDRDAILALQAKARRYDARAKAIAVDAQIVHYYADVDRVLELLQGLIGELNQNVVEAQRRREGYAFSDQYEHFRTAQQHGIDTSKDFLRVVPNPEAGMGVAGLMTAVSYFGQRYEADARARNELLSKNESAIVRAEKTLREIEQNMQTLETNIDTKLRWETYVGTSDEKRDRKKAWANQDFVMMLMTQLPDYGAASADAFVDCVYTAMMVPHDKVYDEFRALALVTAFEAISEQENYDASYPAECLKLCLCFTEDEDGGIRQELMGALAGMEKYREAMAVGVSISTLRQGDPMFSLVMACLCAELEDYNNGIAWFKLTIQNVPAEVDVSAFRTLDILAKLRNARQREFDEILTPSFAWNYELGFVHDEFMLVNTSAFTLSTVNLTVTLAGNDSWNSPTKPWTRTFYVECIPAGQSVKWDTSQGGHSNVRYPSNATATMKCRQNTE